MASAVSPTFSVFESVQKFFTKTHGDYEKEPLFVIGWFAHVINKLQYLTSYKWGHIAKFDEIGNKIIAVIGYWSLVDFFISAKKTTDVTAQFFQYALTQETDSTQIATQLMKITFLASKAFSEIVEFFEMLVNSKALLGFNITKWKLFGSIAGGAYYFHSLCYNQGSWGEKIIISAIFAIKMIEFCGALQVYCAPIMLLQLVIKHQINLFFASSTGIIFGLLLDTYKGKEKEEG